MSKEVPQITFRLE
jgi:LPXTG-motif cell wall-anchored protein